MKSTYAPDPKPVKRPRRKIRVEDSTVTKRVVETSLGCFCGGQIESCSGRAETGHHVVARGAPHFGDDVVENIAPASGHGTAGCHGLIEHYDPVACNLLGQWIMARPAVIGYVLAKLGDVAGRDYIERRYLNGGRRWQTN